jgi:hypothetical protein
MAIFHEHCATAKNSVQAFKYLEWMNKRYGFHFVHAANQKREARVGGQLVDGYDATLRVVLQYMGCEVG